MSENQGGGTTDQSDAGSKDEKKGNVSYESFDKLLTQRKADLVKMNDLSSKLDAFEKKEVEAADLKLQEDGKWKEAFDLKTKMIEDKDKKISDLVSERDSFKSSLVDGAKLQAVVDKLPGRVRKKEYLGFVDTSSILIDPDTGVIDDSSVEQVANGFLKDFSELVDIKDTSKLPGEAGKTAKKLSIEDWKRLPLKERKTRMGDVFKTNTRS